MINDIDLSLNRKILAWAGRRPEPGNITIRLDPLTLKLVLWFAEVTARDPNDVINGCLAGHIGHIREEEEDVTRDDSFEHLAGYVIESVKRRRMLESKNPRKTLTICGRVTQGRNGRH